MMRRISLSFALAMLGCTHSLAQNSDHQKLSIIYTVYGSITLCAQADLGYPRDQADAISEQLVQIGQSISVEPNTKDQMWTAISNRLNSELTEQACMELPSALQYVLPQLGVVVPQAAAPF